MMAALTINRISNTESPAATSLKGMATSRNLILREERKLIWVNLDRSYLAGHVQVKRAWLRGKSSAVQNPPWKKRREDF